MPLRGCTPALGHIGLIPLRGHRPQVTGIASSSLVPLQQVAGCFLGKVCVRRAHKSVKWAAATPQVRDVGGLTFLPGIVSPSPVPCPSPEEWFRNLPPITKAYLVAAFASTILSHFGVVGVRTLVWDVAGLKRFQVRGDRGDSWERGDREVGRKYVDARMRGEGMGMCMPRCFSRGLRDAWRPPGKPRPREEERKGRGALTVPRLVTG